MRDYESENVRVARHLHGQFSSVDQRTFYGSQNGPKMCICAKAVCARSHLSALDRPLKKSLGQVMVSTRGKESRRITSATLPRPMSDIHRSSGLQPFSWVTSKAD